MTTREVTPEGLGPRTALDLSGTERHARGLGPSKSDLLLIRERWAQLTNEALLEAGIQDRVDHRLCLFLKCHQRVHGTHLRSTSDRDRLCLETPAKIGEFAFSAFEHPACLAMGEVVMIDESCEFSELFAQGSVFAAQFLGTSTHL
jgi:hypothetical protein